MQRMRGGLFVVAVMSFSMGCNNRLVTADYKFAIEKAKSVSQGLSSDGGTDLSTECAIDAITCTPYDLGGRIYSGGAMWGQMGPGGDAQSITLIGASSDIIQNPSKGMGGQLTFSLIEGTKISSQHWAPDERAPEKPINRMEFNFDFVDATFDLPTNYLLGGRYVVRTVFVKEATTAEATGTLSLGDKLIKLPGESSFKWCGAEGCSAVRADVTAVVQEANIVNHQFPGQGNPAYVSFSVPLKSTLRLSGQQLNAKGQEWSLAFDMKNAIHWKKAPKDVKTLTELVDAFTLAHGSSGATGASVDTDISVNLSFSQP